MAKILFIGDLHFGCRNNSRVFLKYFKNYFEEELFPYILENNIKEVIQLGDMLDKRKNIDFSVSHYLINDFFNFFEKNKINFTTILGNHDLYFKETTEIAGIKQFISNQNYEYISVIDNIYVHKFKNINLVLCPWICNENKEYIEKTLSDYSFNKDYVHIFCGHLELSGFPMLKNVLAEHDCVNINLLNNFNHVLSGHFHTPSTQRNITYIGTPYQMTWADYGDIKKVMIFDTETNGFDELITRNELFHKFLYTNDILKTFDFEKCKNSYIKLVLNEKPKSNAKYEQFLNELEKQSEPSHVQIIDNIDVENNTEDLINVEIDNPIEILLKTIENEIENKDDTSFVQHLVVDIYTRTLENIQSI